MHKWPDFQRGWHSAQPTFHIERITGRFAPICAGLLLQADVPFQARPLNRIPFQLSRHQVPALALADMNLTSNYFDSQHQKPGTLARQKSPAFPFSTGRAKTARTNQGISHCANVVVGNARRRRF
jgi:hypothetical protein